MSSFDMCSQMTTILWPQAITLKQGSNKLEHSKGFSYCKLAIASKTRHTSWPACPSLSSRACASRSAIYTKPRSSALQCVQGFHKQPLVRRAWEYASLASETSRASSKSISTSLADPFEIFRARSLARIPGYFFTPLVSALACQVFWTVISWLAKIWRPILSFLQTGVCIRSITNDSRVECLLLHLMLRVSFLFWQALFYSQILATNMRWSSASVLVQLRAGRSLQRLIRTRHQQDLAECTIRLVHPDESAVLRPNFSYQAIGFVPWANDADRPGELSSSWQPANTTQSALDGRHLLITLARPIRAVTPGQELVVYHGETGECEGGGHIADGLMNHHKQHPEALVLSTSDVTL
eukprot:m.558251 g.558251  ORF g.558251 m.558251 type:complete len:353 (+) comp57764_c0_seq28:576-1634(+)